MVPSTIKVCKTHYSFSKGSQLFEKSEYGDMANNHKVHHKGKSGSHKCTYSYLEIDINIDYRQIQV